ncbi:adenylate/guanylate cyclase domain-containing protein [Opitutus terrae]|uniref:Adenylate/guanylate cyclase with Chase sensor n=1 Tax=Opitutus terrae (strain DSM 11246 / JCM 15787 / PB90-1) TaxID=452637 RepID=B1ZXQ7_OPITP|nr:adenylate/guanylate cyclase domain-containing protein [Opitutus terrae]ACB74279.1 adenylate/guanylate cyclase with Chase sensor [Opitutus terrae PB90-1]
MPQTPSSGFALRWRWLLPVAVALVAFHFSPLRPTLDWAFFDLASRRPLRSTPPPDGSAIVVIDDATLDQLRAEGLEGNWPPPRAAFAALIAGLERAGAKRIVLDFTFLDHSSAGEQDALLGGLAAGLPNVVLARTERQMPVFWDEAFVLGHPTCFTVPRTGLVPSITDADGVLRRYPVQGSLAAVAAGYPVAFSAAETSPAYNETPPRHSDLGALLRWHGGLNQLRGFPERVPVLSAARFILAGLPMVVRAAEAAPEFGPTPLAAAIVAEPPLQGAGFDAVRDRIVFVGSNAAGTFDQKPFAIGGLEPGVLFHWTAWANLAGAGFLRELPAWVALALAMLLLAPLAALAARHASILLPVLIAAAMAGAVLVAAYGGLSSGWFLPPATPVAAAALGLLGVVAENFWTERRRRQQIKALFGSYVATEVVDLLVRDPAAIQLGGERREATVFFCDLAGFTDLSEEVSPQELLALVNGYLEQTSDCLMAHGAYVDKYIGDAVMAVFGVPKTLPDHALAACRAALAAQRLLAERNTHLRATHGRTLSLRIGVNTGEMVVGNVGSERKKNYTVLGDAVNLASRLEGANKEFGTRILVGAATARQVGNRLVLRPLASLRVKGKQAAVPVFELVGEPDELSPDEEHFLEAYGRGHELYTARRFRDAVAALETARSLIPDDLMTGRLLADSRRFALHPPPPDWLPIVTLDTK